jgi:DNA-binding transcriptional MerR regulator
VAIKINGQMYYRTQEACQKAGVSRATLFRWLKAGVLEDAMRRDRKGWRLFTENDISRIKSEASRVTQGGACLEEAREWTSQESVGGVSHGQESSSY